MWDRVQAIMAQRSLFKPMQPRNLLTGLLFDCFGRPMCAASYNHARYGSYRYYMSNHSSWARRQKLRRMRADADQLEHLLIATLQSFLADREQVRSCLLHMGVVDSALDLLGKMGAASAARLGHLRIDQLRPALQALIGRIELSQDRIKIVVRLEEMRRFLGWDGVGFFRRNDDLWRQSNATHLIDVPAAVVRFRRKAPIPVQPAPDDRPPPVANLVALIREARRAEELVFSNRHRSLPELASIAGRSNSSFARLIRLNYLAPDIIASIIDGTQPTSLTRARLFNASLPLDWSLQRRLLGFEGQADLALANQHQ